MKILTSLAALAMFAGCNAPSSGASNLPSSDSTIADSTIVPACIQDVMLPDTSYPSVNRLEYEVLVIDTVTSGDLGNLQSLYADVDGVLTFRGDPWRRAEFGGKVSGVPDSVEIVWQFSTDADNRRTSFGQWGGGNGWTGQPLHIYWPDSIYQRISADNKQLTKNFSQHEIIVGSLASRVYFINPDNGKATRNSIDVGNPIKGTISIDPTMNGRLYVGQGVPNGQPFGHLTVDLFTNNIINMYGSDGWAWRGWGAFDSSPIRVGDFLFRPGENGILYKYYAADGEERIHSKMRYRIKGTTRAEGMESSMSVYHNYGYFADNGGNVLCVNLVTMKPVWHYDNIDDCDATIVIDEEDGIPYLYSGCEVDKQQGDGKGRLVKINGLTGEEVWCYEKSSAKHNAGSKHFDGGFYATPLLGHGNCDSLLFVNRVDNERGAQNGHFIALSKKTGRMIYETKLNCYSWSSPVSIMNDKDEQYVFTADTHGYVYLFNGLTGEMLCKKLVGQNFEASPLVIGDKVIIGSRGNQIFCLRVK